MRCFEPEIAVYTLINVEAKPLGYRVNKICYEQDNASVVFHHVRNRNQTTEIVVPLDGERNVAPALLTELQRRNRLGFR